MNYFVSEGKKKESDPSRKAPKGWWNKMIKQVSKSNPSYDEETVQKTVGKIWSELSVTKKKEIRQREGKTYGKPKKAAASFLEVLASKYIKADRINVHDSLLHGISYDELITTVHANTDDYSPESVKREFENILQANLKDARHSLSSNMDWIIEQLGS